MDNYTFVIYNPLMKKCRHCGLEKSLKAFGKASNGRGWSGIKATCKSCVNAKVAPWMRKYRKTPKSHDTYRKYRAERRRWYDSLKEFPCFGCGQKYPPYVMDFHHRDKRLKLKNVSKLRNFASKSNILKEIEKCDLLCANCHRKQTFMFHGDY